MAGELSRTLKRATSRDASLPFQRLWRWGLAPAALGGIEAGIVMCLAIEVFEWDFSSLWPGMVLGGVCGFSLGLARGTSRAVMVGVAGGIICGLALSGLFRLNAVEWALRWKLGLGEVSSEAARRTLSLQLAVFFVSIGMLAGLFDGEWRHALQAAARAVAGGVVVYAILRTSGNGRPPDSLPAYCLLPGAFFLVVLCASPILRPPCRTRARPKPWRAGLPALGAIVAGGVALTLGVLVFMQPPVPRGTRERPMPRLVPSGDLPATDVLPHTLGDIVPGRNYVYCGSFALAWGEMRDVLGGAPIRLEGRPPMAEALDQPGFTRSDVAGEAILARAGRVADGIADAIRREMEERFPEAAHTVPEPVDGEELYAYAYLQKDLAFEEEFERNPAPLEFPHRGAAARVRTFGIEEFDYDGEREFVLSTQVTILDHVSDDDFILRLNTTSETDDLVLAKVAPGKTLADTISAVMLRVRNREHPQGYDRKEIEMGESLVIPRLALGVLRRYSEIEGRRVLGAGGRGYRVGRALQAVSFRLDEKGARLESYSTVTICGIPPPPRHFVFDKPFLVYLREKSSHRPYFAMWVANAEVMERVDR
ncbi:MAG: hypothetical protein ACYS9X_01435 [Planctomycetota bacterium]|jgi:hypothetical protein